MNDQISRGVDAPSDVAPTGTVMTIPVLEV